MEISLSAPSSAGPAFRAGRAEAAALCWDWRKSAVHDAADPAPARCRGLRQTLIAGAVALIIYFFISRTMAAVVITIATLNLVAALLSPLGAFARIEHWVGSFAHAVGGGLTWLLLVPLFALFFVPFRLLLRRGTRDAMKRFYMPDAPTYWRQRGPGDIGPRERQF